VQWLPAPLGWYWRWPSTWVRTRCAPSPWRPPRAWCAVRRCRTPGHPSW
jgi:hypothetical protein